MKQIYIYSVSVFEWQQCGAVVCRLIPLSFHMSMWVLLGSLVSSHSPNTCTLGKFKKNYVTADEFIC